jgi:hypothetical protein
LHQSLGCGTLALPWVNFRNVEHIIVLWHLSSYILSVIFPLALSFSVFTSVVGLVYLRLERSACMIVPSNCVCLGVQTSMRSGKLRFGRFICIVAPDSLFE